ncbi:MAG: four helix bundle protein [Opitutaceae bacterium]|jgi:four helix bundle protein
MNIRSFRELEAYQVAFSLQQEIFLASKNWPREENYALTDQARRASRSIGSNLAEAWAKRRYPAHFLSKLTDSDGELQETLHWIDTALACEYLDIDGHAALTQEAESVGRLIGGIMAKHESFCG